MKHFYDVVNNRRSVRSYKSEPIPETTLDAIRDAVLVAPSACNLQPWSFRVILNPEIKKSICECYSAPWLKEAPAIVVALGNREKAWKRLEGNSVVEIDLGIAMEHLVLAAEAEGLSTCWICAYKIEEMNKALNILPPWDVLAISPLGIAKEPVTTPRTSQNTNSLWSVIR